PVEVRFEDLDIGRNARRVVTAGHTKCRDDCEHRDCSHTLHIKILLRQLIAGETTLSFGNGFGPPFDGQALLDDDFTQHEWMRGAVIRKSSGGRELVREPTSRAEL